MAKYTVEMAKRIVKEVYPKARCCELVYRGYLIYTGREDNAKRLSTTLAHGLSKGEAWKLAAAFTLDRKDKESK